MINKKHISRYRDGTRLIDIASAGGKSAHWLCSVFHDAAAGLGYAWQSAKTYTVSHLNGLKNSAANIFKKAGHEAHILEEGALHLGAADEDTKTAFRRDIANCAVETGLTIMEEVTFEATLAVAALEAGEKIANTPPDKISAAEIAASFVESVTSSAAAATHAAFDTIRDLERSGEEWEAHHPNDKKPDAKKAAPETGGHEDSFIVPPYIPFYI